MDNNNSLLVKSNIFQVGEGNSSINIDLEIPNNLNMPNFLFGTVKNICTCKFISGATISIIDMNGNIVKNALTNKYGEYCIYSIDEGCYEIALSYEGIILSYDYINIGKNLINSYNFCLY